MSVANEQSMLSQAFSMHQTGHLEAAEQLYRKLLVENDKNLRGLSLLGMLRMQRGDWQEGAELLTEALQLDPLQPDVLSNLGYALQMLKRPDEALQNYDKAIALFPDHVSAYYNRGRALIELGRNQEAIESLQRAHALRSDHVETCVCLGNAFNSLERYDEALSCYIKALNLRPNDPGISNNLGLALKALGRFKEALTYFRKAITLQPAYGDAYYNQAIALQEQGLDEEALASCSQAIALGAGGADAYCRQGLLLQEMGRHDEALASYQAALAADPENIGAITRLGTLHMELGRKQEAADSFQRALELAPECAEAYYNLAMQGQYAADEVLRAGFDALYARSAELPVTSQIYLNFAMGKISEDMGRYDEAFEAYAAGNHLYHLSSPVDEVGADKLLEDTRAFFCAELFEECRRLSSSMPVAEDGRGPVFIVGMPRSGSTLIEQILASHPEVFGAGELKTFDRVTAGLQLPQQGAPGWEAVVARLARLGEQYLSRVWSLAPGARYITDKMPANYLHLGLLHLMLPQAKIIHAVRNPLDTCFSCYANHFSEGQDFSYDLATLGRHYQRYAALMQHWNRVLPPGSILDVRYEDVIADPEREVRRILAYLELPWDEACLQFHENERAVRTASLDQVRKPIYDSSVERWRRFEQHLKPLVEIVATVG